MNFFKNLTRRSVELFVRRSASIAVLLMILLFAGCTEEQEDTTIGHLNGVWINNSAGYITTIKIDTSAKTVEYVNSYKGDIVNAPDYTAVNGVLIIKFTKYWDMDYSSYPDITYTENTTNIDKYGALYWKGLTDNSVYMADAYDASYNHVMFDDFSEAQTNFTIDKVGDYIDWSIVSPYTK